MTDVRRRWVRPLIVAVVAILAVLVVLVVLAVVGGRGAVRTSADVEVGGCVVARDLGNQAVAVDAVGCTGDGMTFYVSDGPDGRSPCPELVAGSDRIAAPLRLDIGGNGALCLVPDLRQGRCYLLPVGDDGSTARRAVRYERKGCTTVAGSADSPIYAVTRRVDGVARADCPAGDVAWGTERPRPIAYCLAPTRAG